MGTAPELLEQIKTLLTTREQFVVEKTGHQNSLTALKRKVIRTPLAEKMHEKAIGELKEHIRQLEEEIKRLIDQDPDFRNMVGLLISIPGVGLLLAAHMLVVIQSAPCLVAKIPGRLYRDLSLRGFQWYIAQA